MDVPAINYIAVMLATLSTLVVGFIWYAPPVFGRVWMREARVNPTGGRKSAVRPVIVSTLVSFLTAWVLAGATWLAYDFYEGSFLVNALLTAVILWAGFTAARFVVHDQFDNRTWKLTALNAGHDLVTVLVMALIIGVWPPA